MNVLLVRVGADQSQGGGHWNGAVDGATGEFVYVAIPENAPVHPGHERPYAALGPALDAIVRPLPPHFLGRHMHLDPDFEQLTYGDHNERARQLRDQLQAGDWVVFYAALADVTRRGQLVYALIGLLVVDRMVLARDVAPAQRDLNAHTRRVLAPGADDLVVIGRRNQSGRLHCCMPIGEWRAGAYRVRRDLLDAWGGLSVNDGWLQRSARLPRFMVPAQFRAWFDAQRPVLLAQNNL
jgi:hypothetical protein